LPYVRDYDPDRAWYKQRRAVNIFDLGKTILQMQTLADISNPA